MQLHKQIIKWPPNSFVKNIFGSLVPPPSLYLSLSVPLCSLLPLFRALLTLFLPHYCLAVSLLSSLMQPGCLRSLPCIPLSLSLPALWFIFCASVEWTETSLATCGKQKTGRKKASKLGARGVYSILLFHLYPVKLVKRGSSDSRDTEMV